MDDDPRLLISPHLRPGERLLWSGRPDASRIVGRADRFLMPMGVVMLLFITFWLYTAISSGAPVFFWGFGLIFVGMGLYLVAGRLVVKRHRKRATVYGLTDRRALVVSGGSFEENGVDSSSLSVQRYAHHVDVVFAAPESGGLFSGKQRVPGATPFEAYYGMSQPGFGFYEVADADGLLGALESARAARS